MVFVFGSWVGGSMVYQGPIYEVKIVVLIGR